MNTPNKLTILRILLVPFFVYFLLAKDLDCNYLIAIIVFVIASITDMLDGKIARKYNLITDFGKFADPLADKILVISAFVCFVQLGIMGAIPVIIVLFREFCVTSVRLVAASNGDVVAANIWGKLKTISQIVAICVILVVQYFWQLVGTEVIRLSADVIDKLANPLNIICVIFIYISVILTVISGVIYVKDNLKFISQTK